MLDGFKLGIAKLKKLFLNGVEVTSTAAELNILDGVTVTTGQINKINSHYTVTDLDGSTGKKACSPDGVSAIAGGTGIADMSLAAPSVGDLATIRINSLTSGSVVVTCAVGVTLNGTNNVATFDAADETLVLAYKAANEWQVVMNIGSVVLSTAA